MVLFFVQLTRRRSEYFSLATKRSQAFAHALQYGEGTPKGDEHMGMVDHWKAEGEKALVNVSKCLLDKLFDEGMLYWFELGGFRNWIRLCICYMSALVTMSIQVNYCFCGVLREAFGC
jgi:hypothetical protein